MTEAIEQAVVPKPELVTKEFLRAELADFRTEFHDELHRMEMRLLLRLGGGLAALITIGFTVLGILISTVNR